MNRTLLPIIALALLQAFSARAQDIETAAGDIARRHVDAATSVVLMTMSSWSSDESAATGDFRGWNFEYYTQGEGRIDVDISPYGVYTYVDEGYEHPAGAAVVPESYVDSDVAVAVAEAAGGADFRKRYGGSLWVRGGPIEDIDFSRTDYRERALWRVSYYSAEGGSLTVFVGMESGELVGGGSLRAAAAGDCKG